MDPVLASSNDIHSVYKDYALHTISNNVGRNSFTSSQSPLKHSEQTKLQRIRSTLRRRVSTAGRQSERLAGKRLSAWHISSIRTERQDSGCLELDPSIKSITSFDQERYISTNHKPKNRMRRKSLGDIFFQTRQITQNIPSREHNAAHQQFPCPEYLQENPNLFKVHSDEFVLPEKNGDKEDQLPVNHESYREAIYEPLKSSVERGRKISIIDAFDNRPHQARRQSIYQRPPSNPTVEKTQSINRLLKITQVLPEVPTFIIEGDSRPKTPDSYLAMLIEAYEGPLNERKESYPTSTISNPPSSLRRSLSAARRHSIKDIPSVVKSHLHKILHLHRGTQKHVDPHLESTRLRQFSSLEAHITDVEQQGQDAQSFNPTYSPVDQSNSFPITAQHDGLPKNQDKLQINDLEIEKQNGSFPGVSQRSKELLMWYLKMADEPTPIKLNREVSLTVAKMTENRHTSPDNEGDVSRGSLLDFEKNGSDFWDSVRIGRNIVRGVQPPKIMKRVSSGDFEHRSAASWVVKILEEPSTLRTPKSHLNIGNTMDVRMWNSSNRFRLIDVVQSDKIISSRSSSAKAVHRIGSRSPNHFPPNAIQRSLPSPLWRDVHQNEVQPTPGCRSELPLSKHRVGPCVAKRPSLMRKATCPKIIIPANKEIYGAGFSSPCSEFKCSDLSEILLASPIDGIQPVSILDTEIETTSSSCSSLSISFDVDEITEDIDLSSRIAVAAPETTPWLEPNFYGLPCGCCDLVFEGYEEHWTCTTVDACVDPTIISSQGKPENWDNLKALDDELIEKHAGVLHSSRQSVAHEGTEEQCRTLADLQPEQARKVPTWMELGREYQRRVKEDLNYKRDMQNRYKAKEPSTASYTGQTTTDSATASDELFEIYPDYTLVEKESNFDQHMTDHETDHLCESMKEWAPPQCPGDIKASPCTAPEPSVTGINEVKRILNYSYPWDGFTGTIGDTESRTFVTKGNYRAERQSSSSSLNFLSQSSENTDYGEYCVRGPKDLFRVPPNTREATPNSGYHKVAGKLYGRKPSSGGPSSKSDHRIGFKFTEHRDSLPESDGCRQSSFSSLLSFYSRSTSDDDEQKSQLRQGPKGAKDNMDQKEYPAFKQLNPRESHTTVIMPDQYEGIARDTTFATKIVISKAPTKRVGDLISLFQGHGIMPQIQKSTLNGSPPRTPSTSENFGSSHQSAFFPCSEKGSRVNTRASPDNLQCRSNSPYLDDDTDMSSTFGESLERVGQVENRTTIG